MQPDQTLAIGGFNVISTDRPTLARRLLDGLAQGRQQLLFFVNTNLVVKGRALLAHQDDPGVILANDGIGLDIAARLMHGVTFRENLNGTDFTPYLFECAPAPLRVYMVGARPDVLERAAAHVRDRLGQQVVGTCDGYAGVRQTPARRMISRPSACATQPATVTVTRRPSRAAACLMRRTWPSSE